MRGFRAKVAILFGINGNSARAAPPLRLAGRGLCVGEKLQPSADAYSTIRNNEAGIVGGLIQTGLKMSYMFGYDLDKEGSRYSEVNKKLTGKIKELFTTYWHQLDSTWIVDTEMCAKDIRDAPAPFIDENSELLVTKCGPEGAWKGFSEKGSNWLKSHL